ncbi:hypothetical protein KCV00_g389, partial [Aureobasidium melanogenum]
MNNRRQRVRVSTYLVSDMFHRGFHPQCIRFWKVPQNHIELDIVNNLDESRYGRNQTSSKLRLMASTNPKGTKATYRHVQKNLLVFQKSRVYAIKRHSCFWRRGVSIESCIMHFYSYTPLFSLGSTLHSVYPKCLYDRVAPPEQKRRLRQQCPRRCQNRLSWRQRQSVSTRHDEEESEVLDPYGQAGLTKQDDQEALFSSENGQTPTSSLVQSVHNRLTRVGLEPRGQQQTFFFVEKLRCLWPVADPKSREDANNGGQDTFNDEDPVSQVSIS